ncbi:hypothetical protein V8J82_22855 [Gymnodinialimonas sp. 2305UL16-5]|uniref:hypothetical protein n=1 Tax=Gymnodinialimonas mytili TaxID=3126503 RepID=UPI00309B2C43
MEQNQPLQVLFEPGERRFEAVSGTLICGSFFDGSVGLGFNMAAALVVRSLKDMLFILLGFPLEFPGLYQARILECGLCVYVY